MHTVLRDTTLGHALVGYLLLGQKPLNRYPANFHTAVLVLHARVRRELHAQGWGKMWMQQMSTDRRRWITALREGSPRTSHHMVLWRQGGPPLVVLSMQRSIPRR